LFDAPRCNPSKNREKDGALALGGRCLINIKLINLKGKKFVFGGKVLTDEKSGQFFLGPFLIQPIILFLFVLIFLLSEWIWWENTVGGSWAGQICLFLAKNSM
jgi:hypothetical protein